jgi:hypothetical protein
MHGMAENFSAKRDFLSKIKEQRFQASEDLVMFKP